MCAFPKLKKIKESIYKLHGYGKWADDSKLYMRREEYMTGS